MPKSRKARWGRLAPLSPEQEALYLAELDVDEATLHESGRAVRFAKIRYELAVGRRDLLLAAIEKAKEIE